jgi:hypothetical protein
MYQTCCMQQQQCAVLPAALLTAWWTPESLHVPRGPVEHGLCAHACCDDTAASCMCRPAGPIHAQCHIGFGLRLSEMCANALPDKSQALERYAKCELRLSQCHSKPLILTRTWMGMHHSGNSILRSQVASKLPPSQAPRCRLANTSPAAGDNPRVGYHMLGCMCMGVLSRRSKNLVTGYFAIIVRCAGS